jgi:predicted metal-dependent peptidase
MTEQPEKIDPRELDVQAMRIKAVAKAGYLGTAIWSLTPVSTPGLCDPAAGTGGMAVDKYWRLYYDPVVFDNWTMEENAAVTQHEIWHLLRDHPARAQAMGLDPMDRSVESQAKFLIWNIAGDFEINDDLRDENAGLPEGLLYPDNPPYNYPVGLTAEEYYDMLWEEHKDDVEKLEQMVAGAGYGDPDGNDGSGATGMAGPWEVGPDGNEGEEPQDGKPQEVPAGVPVGEGDLLKKQVAQEVSKQAGTAPGFAKRWADEMLHPQIDWRTILRGAIRGAIMDAAGMVDYRYDRPNRRSGSPALRRIVMPRLRGPRPKVQVAIDTSGSMTAHDLEIALGEVKGILDATQAIVEVFAVDTAVADKQKVYNPKDIELIGGGGTDMGNGLRAMAEDRAPIAIVLTDGYTPWPNEKPKGLGRVIVALVKSDRYGSPPDPPGYATVVETWNESGR